MNTKEMREKRGELIVAMRKINDKAVEEKRDLTAEEQKSWDDINADFDQLGRNLERAERLETVGASLEATGNDPDRLIGRHDQTGHPAGEEPDPLSHDGRHGNPDTNTGPTRAERQDLALRGWMLHQRGLDTTKEHQEAARACGIRLAAPSLEIPLLRGAQLKLFMRHRMQRAMATNPLDVGGVLVVGELVPAIEEALLDFSGVRQVASILRTAKGGPLTFPTDNDTTNKGRRIDEGAPATKTDLKLGGVVFQAYKYSSDEVLISNELLTDSEIPLAPFIGNRLGTRIGRVTNDDFTTGTGASQPKGIVTASTLGVTAASATVIATDELFDLEHSVDPAYRSSGFNVGWMMHDSVMKVVRKLKDTTDQYLWNPGLTTGVPQRLLGYPVTINQSMAATVEADAITLLFGALSKYNIRDIASMRLLRLVERHAENDQEAFIAFSRHDGNLLDAGTNPVKHLVQAP